MLVGVVDHERMPRWVPRAILLAVVALAAVEVAGALVVRLQGLLVLLLVSAFLSFALEPAVNSLERRGWRRGAGTAAVFGGAIVATVAFAWAMGSVVVDQAARLVDAGPGYITEIETWVETTFGVEVDTDQLAQEFRAGGAVAGVATRLAGDLFEVGRQITTAVFQLLTVLLFTFYLVADGPALRRAVCSLLPPDRQREVLRAWELAIDKTGGYLYSRALLAVLAVLAHWLAFLLIDVPFPLPLAIWVGVLSQFIPTIGTYLAGALPLLIAVLDDPSSALWVLGFVLVYQQVENYFLLPRATAQQLDMHPAVAFGSVIAGGLVLGAVGAVLAIPAAAIGQAFVGSYLHRHEVIESDLTTPPPRRRRWRRRRAPGGGGDLGEVDARSGPQGSDPGSAVSEASSRAAPMTPSGGGDGE